MSSELHPVAGTRPSNLAVSQTQWVLRQLAASTGLDLKYKPISTHGDRNSAPLARMTTPGVFVAELRAALLEGAVDFAVHSMKDLPSAAHPGLITAAVPVRERVHDVLVSVDSTQKIADLPHGAKVGTGAPRRRAQLLRQRPDLDVIPIRGNIGTRVARVSRGDLDAVVLASAGLRRVGSMPPKAVELDFNEMIPAPGQGALAIECRIEDEVTREILASIDDPTSRTTATVEREVLAALAADCTAPVGALCELSRSSEGDRLVASAIVLDLNGHRCAQSSGEGPASAPGALGQRLAAGLLDRGAKELLRSADVEARTEEAIS